MQLPTPPPWIENLPRDSRGFPVPAEAGWVSDEPILSKVATDRKVALGMRRACAVCGYRLSRDQLVYRAFAQADAAHMRQFERERANDAGGPLHLSCILYSAMACPYLREKRARLRKDNEINPGSRRGTLAAIMGFRDFGLMIYKKPHQFLDPDVPAPLFAYLGLVEDIRYRDGSELQDQYDSAVESDALTIDLDQEPMYWTSDAKEQRHLSRALRADFRKISGSQPTHEEYMVGVGGYLTFSTYEENELI